MIPRFKPTVGLSELLAALRPPRKDDVERFEQSFARLMGQKHALAFPYGRTGLMMLLQALGLNNKEVICPAYTCVVVPHAIVYSGNIPVFVDCEPNGFNMDLDLAEKAITEKTGAVIATSLFGYPVNLDRLDEIRNHHPNLLVIQDCAHSFAAEWRGRQVQKAGAAAIFGFNISKMLTSIFGGTLSTDDTVLYELVKGIRDQKLRKPNSGKVFRRFLYLAAVYPTFWGPIYTFVNKLERGGVLDAFSRYYDEKKIDMPRDFERGLSRIEAAVGETNLGRYREIVSRRREAADYYFDHLENGDGFILPPRVSGATYSHYVVRVDDRDRWLNKALQKGVQLGWIIEYSIPEMEAYGRHPHHDFPVAGEYSRRTINLPVWGGAELAKRVVERVFREFEA